MTTQFSPFTFQIQLGHINQSIMCLSYTVVNYASTISDSFLACNLDTQTLMTTTFFLALFYFTTGAIA